MQLVHYKETAIERVDFAHQLLTFETAIRERKIHFFFSFFPFFVSRYPNDLK